MPGINVSNIYNSPDSLWTLEKAPYFDPTFNPRFIANTNLDHWTLTRSCFLDAC